MLRFVYPTDSRIGIPRVIVSRAVLGARTPAEAIRHMLIPHRAAGYNHLLAHDSGELYNVEYLPVILQFSMVLMGWLYTRTITLIPECKQ